MRRLIERLLCFLGWHQWNYFVYNHINYDKNFYYSKHTCAGCPKVLLRYGYTDNPDARMSRSVLDRLIKEEGINWKEYRKSQTFDCPAEERK